VRETTAVCAAFFAATVSLIGLVAVRAARARFPGRFFHILFAAQLILFAARLLAALPIRRTCARQESRQDLRRTNRRPDFTLAGVLVRLNTGRRGALAEDEAWALLPATSPARIAVPQNRRMRQIRMTGCARP